MNSEIMERIQVRTKHAEYQMHIQILGSINVNREYGYASELRAPEAVIEWLAKQEPVHKSAASDTRLYIEAEVVKFKDTTNAFLIHGTPLNNEAGCLLGVNPESPVVIQMFDYATQADKVKRMNKEQAMSFTIGGEEE